MQSSKQLTQTLYEFNRYKRRFTNIFYVMTLLSIVYVIVYFAGFIINEINQPPVPGEFKPFDGVIMDILIYSSFLLQIIYLGLAWKHIKKWNIYSKKLDVLESKILDELDL